MVFGTPQLAVLRASGPCPGHPNHFSAIRAELSGLAASVYLLYIVCQVSNMQGGTVILYNDCQKAHKLINSPGRKFKRYLVDDYDLLAEICHNIQELSKMVSFQLVWIKSHYKGHDRDIQHDLNEEAHKLATSALSLSGIYDHPPPPSLVDLWCGYSTTSKWESTIKELAYSDSLHNTILSNSQWTEEQFNMVDWPTLRQCLNGMSRIQQLSHCKLLHGLLNTNEQNHRYYKQSALCPHCKSASESFPHVISCSHLAIQKQREAQQEVLWKSLEKLKTPPSLLTVLCSALQSLSGRHRTSLTTPSVTSNSTGSQQSSPECFPVGVREAQCQQMHDIGWDQFLRGCISKLWQEIFYQENIALQQWADKRWWAAGLIRAVLQYSLSLWKF
jgi:hypothetical protein